MTLANIVIVEDDTFVRATTATAMASMQINVVLATDQPNAAITACRENQVDVALLDLDLGPGPTGIDVAFLMRKQNPEIGLVFLTSYSDPRLLGSNNQTLPVGARYLTKSKLTDLRQLVTTIVQTKAQPLKRASSKSDESNFDLTDHQIEVLQLVAQGLSSSQIAANLDVSEKAVEASISRINQALGIGNSKSQNLRVQLTRAYFQLSGKKPPRV